MAEGKFKVTKFTFGDDEVDELMGDGVGPIVAHGGSEGGDDHQAVIFADRDGSLVSISSMVNPVAPESPLALG